MHFSYGKFDIFLWKSDGDFGWSHLLVGVDVCGGHYGS